MKKKICVGAMALGVAVALAAPASAQDEPEAIEHVFDDAENVEGATVGPYVGVIQSRVRRGHRTLIQPRYTFVPEMLKTVEDL